MLSMNNILLLGVSCSLRNFSLSLVKENSVCGSVSGGGVCYSGDSVGSVAVYFCDDGYTIEGDTTRECLSSVVCSVIFGGIGVVLGVVGLYLIQRVRGRSSGPTSSSPPPLPPPVTYEEVDVTREVKRSQDIQLISNEA